MIVGVVGVHGVHAVLPVDPQEEQELVQELVFQVQMGQLLLCLVVEVPMKAKIVDQLMLAQHLIVHMGSNTMSGNAL